MKKKVRLEIKAEDIRNSNYYDTSDCPITRALERAGCHGFIDVGVEIIDADRNTVVREGDYQYDELVHIVISMVSSCKGESMSSNRGIVTPLEPSDFTITLELDI